MIQDYMARMVAVCVFSVFALATEQMSHTIMRTVLKKPIENARKNGNGSIGNTLMLTVAEFARIICITMSEQILGHNDIIPLNVPKCV